MPTGPKGIQVNGRSYHWPAQPIVVVCVDGFKPDYIEQTIKAGFIPWMKSMIYHMGTDLRGHCVVPSSPNPNHMSMVTGVSPKVHGTGGNFYYDRDNDVEVMMNEPSLLRTPTIFKVFQDAVLRWRLSLPKTNFAVYWAMSLPLVQRVQSV